MSTAPESRTFAEEVREYLQEDLDCSETIFVDARDAAFTVDDAIDLGENEIISLSYYTPASVVHISVPLDAAVLLNAALEQTLIRATANQLMGEEEDAL